MNYILLSLLLLASLWAKESDFSLIIDKPYDNELFDITQDYDRHISAVGFSNNYKNSSARNNIEYSNPFDYLASLSNKYGSKINFIKIDDNANILLDKTLNVPMFHTAVSVLKTPSNGYFVGGYTQDGSLIVLKLDANANVIFNKSFGTKNYDKMNTLISLRDGGVLAIGSSVSSRFTNDDLYKNGLGGNDIYITKFSATGEELWSRKYGTEYDDIGIDAVEANDGSIIVLSTTKNNSYKDISLMRITENGNKIWLKNYEFKTTTTPHKIIRLQENNFLVSLSQKNSVHKNQIRLLKFDLHNNLLIDKNISTTYASGLKDIKEYANGDLMGVGFVKDTYNNDGLVMVLSSELKLICQEHFGGESYDIFNSVSILHNSQSAVSGIYTSQNSQESNMWIAKLNRDCTMAQLPLKSIDIYEELTKLFQEEIDANKLLIKKDLSIEFIDYSLYFKLSKYKLSKTQKEFLNRFQKKLIPFLYSIKNEISVLEINGQTSSEWGNANFSDTYVNNANLSIYRAYSTLSYIFKAQDAQTQKWLTKVLKGSGSSYSQRVMLGELENREKSRRVSFKIILNTQAKSLVNSL